MGFIKDFISINRVVMKKTSKKYAENISLVLGLSGYIIIYFLLMFISYFISSKLGRVGSYLTGLLSWFISCFLISDFLYNLGSIINGGRFRLKYLFKNARRYFMPTLAATAIPSIVIFLFSSLTRIYVPRMILYVFYLLYATGEIIYQKDKDSLEIFVYGHHFLIENWKLWISINFILGGICTGIFYLIQIPVLSLIGYIPLSVDIMYVQLLATLLVVIILSVPGLFYMLYRGYIFKILSVSSSRKREYMRNIYGE